MGDTRGTVHFVGIDVQIGTLLRQRCAWCGDVLLDYDLERLAVPVGQQEGPATWPVGTLVEVDGNATWAVEHDAADPLPENTCARLLADLEARFKEALGKPPVLLPIDPKYREFVLTWHPVAEGMCEPVEVPLNEHIVWAPAANLGEFVVSTREVPPPAGGRSEGMVLCRFSDLRSEAFAAEPTIVDHVRARINTTALAEACIEVGVVVEVFRRHLADTMIQVGIVLDGETVSCASPHGLALWNGSIDDARHDAALAAGQASDRFFGDLAEAYRQGGAEAFSELFETWQVSGA